MTRLNHNQVYSKGRYICHCKVVIYGAKLYTMPIQKIIWSPRRVNNKYVLAKSALVQTSEGSVKILNKPSKAIPAGVYE